MEIKTYVENGRVPITVIHVDGNIDSLSYQTFKTRADELIKEGARHILVDLSHVPFISSAGLRAFHETFNQLRKIHPDANLSEEEVKKGIAAGTYKSPHFKLLNLSEEAKGAFHLSGFDMFIETFTDIKAAINAF